MEHEPGDDEEYEAAKRALDVTERRLIVAMCVAAVVVWAVCITIWWIIP